METKGLNPDQIDFAIKKIADWIYIREDVGYGLPNSADVHHSFLLRRLLSGKPPLDRPPPKRFSYPSYELGEGKEVEIYEIREFETPIIKGAGTVSIDQNMFWEWADKEKQILRFMLTGDLYQYSEKEGIPCYRAKFLKKIKNEK